jgi:transposase
MPAKIIGLDIGKRAFHVVGLDVRGHVHLRQQLRRDGVLNFFANLPMCLVAIETCPSMHYWMREIAHFGHDVRAIHARYVRPYVKTQKNDFNDAEAIAEAASRGHMRFVQAKSVEHQAILHLHRSRELLMRQRNAAMNHVRSMLAEYGLIMNTSTAAFFRDVTGALEALQARAEGMICNTLQTVLTQVRWLHEQVRELEREIAHWHRRSEPSRRLGTLPGVGPLSATALVAVIGDPARFGSAREFAASIGLVPRQHSTGGKARLLGISKHGDRYLRTLLAHGARAVVWAHDRERRLGKASARPWLGALLERRHRNVAIIAQAHKTARIAWALLRRGGEYHATHGSQFRSSPATTETAAA